MTSVAGALRSSAETMTVVLPVFWSMLQLGTWWSPPVDSIVFAVMLGVALPRALRAVERPELAAALGMFAAASGAAVGCGMLLTPGTGLRALGGAAFSAGVALLVWLRRFAARLRRPCVIASTPFIAVLVAPRSIDRTWALMGWMLVAAGVAMAWALTARALRGLPGGLPAPSPSPRPGPSRRPRGGLPASTRMAVHLGCATAASFAAAQLMDPDHLVWPVLTVLIVHSVNQGRGDVLWKGAQRIIGALAGTGIATVLSTWSGTGEATALVALFAILAVAAAARLGLRPLGGRRHRRSHLPVRVLRRVRDEMLGHRLLGVLAGGAIGIACAWFVLPVRTFDVARLRIGTLLTLCRGAISAIARGESIVAFEQPLTTADRHLRRLGGTVGAAGRLGSGTARELLGVMADAHALASRLLGMTVAGAPVRGPAGPAPRTRLSGILRTAVRPPPPGGQNEGCWPRSGADAPPRSGEE